MSIVPTFIPTAQVTSGGYDLKQKTELKIKNALCAQGAYEGVHYSFFSPSDLDLIRLPEDAEERKAIKLLNPITIDLSLMRTVLAPQMITSIARNQKNGILEGRIFEIGNRFIAKELPLKAYPDERPTLCIGIFGEKEDFFGLKGLCDTVADALDISFEYAVSEKTFLHPFRTADIICGGEKIGYLGQLKYEIARELDMRTDAYIAEMDLRSLEKYFGKERVFIPLPKYPVEKRDFSFVMDKDITCGEVEKTILEACDMITDIELFDIYEGIQLPPNKKSMAFSCVFTPKDEKLTDQMMEGYVNDILKALDEKLGIVLRF